MKQLHTFLPHVTAIGIIAALLLAPFSHTGSIQKTYAGFYLESTGQDALGFQEESAIQNTITAEMITDLREKMIELDPAQWEVSQKMAAKSTENIIEWVNSGFDGDPAFVTDLDSYIDEKVDEDVEKFLEDLQEVAMTTEEKEQYAYTILNSLGLAETAHAQTPFGERITDIARDAYERRQSGEILGDPSISEDSYAGFRDGTASVDEFMRAISNSSNLPVTRASEAISQMEAVIQNTVEREKTILNWGDGFRSFETCTEDGGDGEQCQITTPGNVISEMLNKALGLGLDSLINSDEINQMVDLTFGRMGELALTMENGLSGMLDLGSFNLESLLSEFGLEELDLDPNSIAGRLFETVINEVLAGDNGGDNEDEPLGVTLTDLLNIAYEIEEQYLELMEQALVSGPEDVQERILEEDEDGNNMIDISENNLAALDELIAKVEEILDEGGVLGSQRTREDLLAVMEEFYELQPNLARRSDVQILRNELEED